MRNKRSQRGTFLSKELIGLVLKRGERFKKLQIFLSWYYRRTLVGLQVQVQTDPLGRPYLCAVKSHRSLCPQERATGWKQWGRWEQVQSPLGGWERVTSKSKIFCRLAQWPCLSETGLFSSFHEQEISRIIKKKKIHLHNGHAPVVPVMQEHRLLKGLAVWLPGPRWNT